MGAGDYPAGVGPCGHDPMVTNQSRVFVTPDALKYDGATKAFIQDATTGKLEKCHPVDQKMAFGLLFRRGSIKGDIRIGNTFHEIQSVRNADIQQQLWDRARTAVPVSDVLLAGDAEILRIGYEERPHGGLTIVIEYVNKRLKNSNPRRVDYRIES